VPEVAALERQVFADPWPARAFEADLANRRLSYLRVARLGGRLAGYLVAALVEGEVHLTNLGVHPDLRRRGVAQQLLDDLLGEARRSGAELVTLEVRMSNAAAIALYLRNGFREVAIRRGYYDVGREDALVMTLDLAAGGGGGDG